MARNKGDKDYSKLEKQLLISLINNYLLFEVTGSEIIQMLSTKIGKKISEIINYCKEEHDVAFLSIKSFVHHINLKDPKRHKAKLLELIMIEGKNQYDLKKNNILISIKI